MADIPVYLVAGFLDAGKTNFINGILEDGFARQDPTLLLCCEEGEEEYEKNALDNVTVITIEDEEDLKCSYLKELEKEYHPKQVLIEYNGMWQMELFWLFSLLRGRTPLDFVQQYQVWLQSFKKRVHRPKSWESLSSCSSAPMTHSRPV